MIVLNEVQISRIEEELLKSISDIDLKICEAEQAMRAEINGMQEAYTPEKLASLEGHLGGYEAGVRELRTKLAHLRRKTHELLEPAFLQNEEEERQKEKIAVEMQREAHSTPASFSDFVKGLLMWKESPEDRMSA